MALILNTTVCNKKSNNLFPRPIQDKINFTLKSGAEIYLKRVVVNYIRTYSVIARLSFNIHIQLDICNTRISRFKKIIYQSQLRVDF